MHQCSSSVKSLQHVAFKLLFTVHLEKTSSGLFSQVGNRGHCGDGSRCTITFPSMFAMWLDLVHWCEYCQSTCGSGSATVLLLETVAMSRPYLSQYVNHDFSSLTARLLRHFRIEPVILLWWIFAPWRMSCIFPESLSIIFWQTACCVIEGAVGPERNLATKSTLWIRLPVAAKCP